MMRQVPVHRFFLVSSSRWRMRTSVVGARREQLMYSRFSRNAPLSTLSPLPGSGYYKENNPWLFVSALAFISAYTAATVTAMTTTHCQSSSSPTEQQQKHKEQPFAVKQCYDIDQVLGEGAYGVVFLARRKADGAFVALKTIPRKGTDEKGFRREVRALQILSSQNQGTGHPHVCQLYDLHADEKRYYLALELIQGGELLEHLIENGPYSEAAAAKFLRQFAEGLSFVHESGFSHADLKLENLMLSTPEPKSAKLKVVDFGCATPTTSVIVTEKQNDGDRERAMGTIAYWPPELFKKGAVPTPAGDMWAAGIIVYILVTGTHPLDKHADATDEEIEEALIRLGQSNVWNREKLLKSLIFDNRIEGLSPSCVDLMKRLMHPDPKKRMTCDEFRIHPWVQGLTASWDLLKDSHSKLEAFWQNRFRAEILNKFSASIGMKLSRRDSNGTLSEENLKQLFQALDLKKNGVLELEEIQITFSSLGVKDKDILEIFAAADLDGTGVIHWEEFRTLMRSRFDDGPGLQLKYRQGLFQSSILKQFQNTTSDNNKAASTSEERLREIFNAMDLDGNGVLDPHEIRIVLRTAGEDEDSISRIVAAVDLNHDGGVNWDEFREIMGMQHDI